MPFFIGLDTGGTYTDAIIFDDEKQSVVVKSKALTTHHDLSIGTGEALTALFADSPVSAGDIAMVCLSTTLATNALVEGHSERAGLIMIGFEDRDLDRAGLRETLGGDPVLIVPGGHDVHGRAKPFDLDGAMVRIAEALPDVSGYGVAGLFAVRNPEHEIAVRDALQHQTGKPVTCSHELSAELDGPRRALTTLLNARLVPLIDQLMVAVATQLTRLGISCPVMVVRGDGSLVSQKFAQQRPIETIMSGPAASLVGAHFLTGCDQALVSDIGGTTTDIALLEAGVPKIDPSGATVGGLRTMVKAIAMQTYGLGGDSAVKLDDNRLNPTIELGPERVIPLSLLGKMYGEPVITALKKQLSAPFPDRLAGTFVWKRDLADRPISGLSKTEFALLNQLPATPQPASDVLKGQSAQASLRALIKRGLASLSAVTPSDAQHVLGKMSHWDMQAAQLGIDILAQQKDGYGKPLAPSGNALASRIVERLVHLSAQRCLETALGENGGTLAKSDLAQQALKGEKGIANFSVQFDRPIIGLGAGAQAYYPDVGEKLNTLSIVPAHADVANAVGAVTGQIRITQKLEVAPSDDGRFRILGGDLSDDDRNHRDEASALNAARTAVRQLAEKSALEAGAQEAEVIICEDIKRVQIDGLEQFVSATVFADVLARPSLAK
ncbi:MAG: hydantoinase/oxoprolinase family protein [Pseudomonadota bacterium]